MPSFRLLAVDDEPFNLDLIEFAFADDTDCEIVRAADGQEALAAVEAGPEPDVILLDLAMPRMDGFAVLDWLKSDPTRARLPVIVITANGEERHNALKLGANDFLPKPVDVDELKLRTRNHARLKEYGDYLLNANAELERHVAERTVDLRRALALAQATEREIAYRLGRTAEFRDMETGQHIQRMSGYSALLAAKAGLPDNEVELILHAAPLHDIGKVGIPDRILLKPGKLRDDEYEIMKQHTTIGGRMLEGCERYPLLAAGRTIALQHHEKYDGSGYPGGLAGEAIHLYGRIVAIADVFDALTSRRVYKMALSLEETLDLMRAQSGRHFDPALLDLLFDNLDEALEIRAGYPEAEEETPSILELIKGI